jgi:adenosylcobinamide-GDP ribazoletransferase
VSAIPETRAPTRRWLELRAAAAALAFLTRIPIGRWLDLDGDDVGRAGPAFPLVGAGIGTAVGGIAAALAGPVSPLLAAAIALAAGAVVTGALHLDGLADTADALGARSRERALEIMRDHAIGTYGAVAIGLDFLIKAGALAALARHGHALAFAITAGALSRAVPVLLSATLPYARPGDGAAASLARPGRGWRAAIASIGAVGIAGAVTGTDGLIVGGCAAALTVGLYGTLRRWLGGVTGDTLGGAVELSEAMVLVVAVALVGAG